MPLSSKTLGILLSLFGNTLISFSLTLQKRAHTSPNVSTPEEIPPPDYLINPKWHLGILLMALGELFNLTALSFVPASLVTPLGSWSVVLASLLAWCVLKEDFGGFDWAGMGLCVLGGIMMASGVPDGGKESGVDVKVVGGVGVVVVLGVLSLVMVGKLRGGDVGRKNLGVYVGISSLLGAVTVVCAKYLSLFLKGIFEGIGDDDERGVFGKLFERKELNVLGIPLIVTGVLMGSILTQLYYLNLSMMYFGNAQVVPVYYVLFTFCAIVGSSVVYGELETFGMRNWLFVSGVLATMGGVVLVSRRGMTKESTDEKVVYRRDLGERSEEYELVEVDEECMM